MRLALLLLFPFSVAGQTGMLQPAGDSTFTNVLVGSAVTPAGQVGYTKDIYLVKSDGSAPARLTTFSQSNNAPGATGVAISPDGTRGAYLAILNSGGAQSEEVHTIDLPGGADRRIAVNTTACAQVPCLHNLSFSQDGSKLIWNGAASPGGNAIFAGNYDGSAVRQITSGSLSTTAVTSGDGRLIFSDMTGIRTILTDGTSPVTVAASVGPTSFVEGNISADGSTIARQYCTVFGYGPQPGCVLDAAGSQLDYWPTGSFSGVALSRDGSTAAWIASEPQANTLKVAFHGMRAGSFSDLSFHSAFDVAVSAEGSRILYSTGLGTVRGAVWIADSTGQNARPVFAPRSINIGGITGLSGTSATQLLSLGSYFTIYGTGFEQSSAVSAASSLPLPLSLAGITVTVNGTLVPVEAVTPWQINALLPQEARTGLAALTVQFADGFSLSATPTVASTAPALIAGGVFHGGSGVPADSVHPARASEVMAGYGFGLGVTTPLVRGGDAAPAGPLAYSAAPLQVLVQGQSATVLYSGLVPGLAGLYQANFVVPAGLNPGPISVSWKTADSTSPSVLMYVQ